MIEWRHPAKDSGGCRCGNARGATIAGSLRGRRADCVVSDARYHRRLYMNGGMRTCFFVLASLALMGTVEARYEARWVEGGCWEARGVTEWKVEHHRDQSLEQQWARWQEIGSW